jgi:hypothetical protein
MVNTGVFTAIKDLMHGVFSSNLQENINDGGVGIGVIDPAGAPYKAQIAKIIAEMKSGKIVPTTTIKYAK